MLTIGLVFLFVFINCYPMDGLEYFATKGSKIENLPSDGAGLQEELARQENSNIVEFLEEEGVIGTLGEALARQMLAATQRDRDGTELKEFKNK